MSGGRAAPGLVLLTLLVSGGAGHQGGGTGSRAGEGERIADLVAFLAGDELAGRDTPSPGLTRAAEFLAERFRRAALEPLGGGAGYFHRYRVPGIVLDSRRIEVALHSDDRPDAAEQRPLPDRDVRLWSAGGPFRAPRTAVLVSRIGDTGRERRLRGEGQRAKLVEVAEDDPLWLASSGSRQVLAGHAVGGPPVLLAREGAIPEGSFTATIRIPGPDPVDVALRNPVGILRGSTRPDEFVVVSAHYDHLGVGTPVAGDSIYNGADDASGTAAVVLLAEALAAGEPPARSILFVCFSGEERGLIGSRAFAEDPPVPVARMVANVNIDMIGRPSANRRRSVWVTGPGLSDFGRIASTAMARAGIRVVDFDLADRLFAAGDNISLARLGVVAHTVSASALHADYHRPSDEPAALDLEHMIAVIAGLREVVLELANRQERPSYNESGKARLGLSRRP